MNIADYNSSSRSAHILPAKIIPKTDNEKKLWESAKALEATFAKDLLTAMGDKLPGAPNSPGGNIFGDMFKDTIAKQLAQSETLGLGRQIYRETVKLANQQELGESMRRAIATQNF